MKYEFEKLFYSKRVLINITLELTNSCNLKCKHCYQVNRSSNEKKVIYLDSNVINKLLSSISDSSVINIYLTGGEVFTHPDILDIIIEIKRRNINVNLLTNCTLINENNIKIIKDNINLISTTCYGSTAETYENITRIHGSYIKYQNAMTLLKANGIRFIEKSIIMNDNYCDLEKLLSNTSYIDNRIIVNECDPYSLACNLSDKDHKKYYEYYFSNKANELQQYLRRNKPLRCKLWHNSLYVNCHGDITPCINLEDKRFIFGNIYNDNVLDIWNSETSITLVQKLSDMLDNSPCYNCANGKYCQICPSNNYYETGDVSTPSVHECEICKIKSGIIKNKIMKKEIII